jgi:hypothetical protein
MLAGDPDDHFVEMPAITWSRTAPPQSPSDCWSEFEHPTASALVGDVEPTLGKQFLNIAIAQGETKVQPDGVLDDDRWKAMPAIGDRNHDRTLPPDSPSSQAVTLTKPTAAPCRQPTPPAGSPEPRFRDNARSGPEQDRQFYRGLRLKGSCRPPLHGRMGCSPLRRRGPFHNIRAARASAPPAPRNTGLTSRLVDSHSRYCDIAST